MSKAIKKLKQIAKEIQSCPVCMVRAVNCKTLECSHQFCYRCLSKWGRRKGNCPLCRTNIRKIHYKKKIIEPQYLKYFDEQSSIQAIQQVQEVVGPRQTQATELVAGNFAIFMPMIANFQTMNYYYSYPYLMFANNSA